MRRIGIFMMCLGILSLITVNALINSIPIKDEEIPVFETVKDTAVLVSKQDNLTWMYRVFKKFTTIGK